jgi:opine dehydrogenase
MSLDERPLRLAVLGAGPHGTAMAALAAARGHDVVLWSPRGGGTRHILGAVITRGALAGRWPVRVAADLGRAMEGAQAVLVCLPTRLLPVAVPRIAAALRGDPAILFAPAGGLAASLMAEVLASRGGIPRVAALPALPMTARRDSDGGLTILGARARLWIAGHPGAPSMGRLVGQIFGMEVAALADPLAAGLADPTPVFGAARLLAPARMEDAPLRLLAALGRERDLLASACRRHVPPLHEMLAGLGTLPEPELTSTLDGLAFLTGVAGRAEAKLPLLGGALALLRAATGEAPAPHPVWAALAPDTLARALA